MSGSSAASASTSSANTQTQQQTGGGGDAGGAENIDVHALLEQHRQVIEQTQGQFGTSQRELQALKGQHQQTQAVLDGIKKALNGGKDEGDVADPFDTKIEHYTGLIDQYLAAAVEAERAGKPIPLTVKNAIESFQGMIDQLELNKKLTAQLGKLQGNVDQLSNPSNAIDQTAYSAMDSMIQNGLNTIYGEGDDSADVRDAQFAAVAKLVTGEVKKLKTENRDVWDRIRRNPTDQRKLVNHFMQQAIPPRARQLMEDERIRTTPITLSDLQQAWVESKEIKNPDQRKEIQTKLRREILEEVASKGRKRGGKEGAMGINDLYRG